jgi:hypothetical protein
LIGETKTLDTQGVSYEGTQWIRGFMWFGPPKRNTLRQRENENYCIAVCCSRLNLLKRVYEDLSNTGVYPGLLYLKAGQLQ